MSLKSQTPPHEKAKRILLKVPTRLITYVHSLVEECDYIAIVRTLDPDGGIVEFIATEDTFETAMKLSRYFVSELEGEILHPLDMG
jgi:hypothetical protein